MAEPNTDIPNPADVVEARFSDVTQQAEAQAGLRKKTGTILPKGATLDVSPIVEQPSEIEVAEVKPQEINLNTQLANTGNLDTNIPAEFNPGQIEAAQSDINDVPAAIAQQGSVSKTIDLVDAQSEVSAESLATAQTEELDERGTVSFQLGVLAESIQEGKPLPPWASGPARAASAVMQQRGLGKSSMAAAAIISSLVEAGVPIAAADAQAFSDIQKLNLSHKQQTALANAAKFAAMDIANLNARMTALVENSRSFLQIDTQNLTNKQQTESINHQARIQSLFTNTASTNAARNFNATSDNQINSFFTTLDATVQENNNKRAAALQEFDADQANAITRFESSLNDSRDKFYSEIQRQINQSNAVWRRDINTVNTAVQNESNRINTQNVLALSADAQNKLWQQYRDEARFILETSENDRQRAHNAAIVASQNSFNISRYNVAAKDNFWSTVGSAVAGGFFGER